MKKLITVELPRGWVLKHRADDVLPIDLLIKALSDLKIEIKDKSHSELSVIFDDSVVEYSVIKDKIFETVKARYADDLPRVTVNCVEQGSEYKDEPQSVEEFADRDTETDFSELFSAIEKQLGRTNGDDAEENKPDKKNDVMSKINNLVGASEFKQLAREIAEIAPQVRAHNTQDIFSSQCYLFSIGDGCGTTTCAQLLSELLAEVRIRDERSNRSVIERKLPPDKDTAGYDPFEEVKETLDRGRNGNLSVLCVDICEWMNFTERAKFRNFLRLAEKSSDKFIVIFRIPFVEKDVLERIQTSLSDLLYVRAVSFPPLSRSELQTGAKNLLADHGFTVNKSAWEYYDKRIALEKSDGKFYEISTVKKIVNEIIYKKQLANAKKGKDSFVITANDMRGICPESAADVETAGEAQLKSLIGNDKIRARLDEVLAQIELAMKNDGERPCIHMRFVGNPGTGKTTIARILGKILKERGILRIGNFYEYAGRDFCGRYIGETAPKTASMCRDAYGSVLFIDEAYTLYKEGSTVDYGREAIDTLIAEMENHRNDFVVIMAGYTDDMNNLMRGNLGLASRMPYTIEFPNFTRDELYGIFRSMVTAKFKCDDKLLASAKEYFTNLSDEVISAKTFSNARYVRNLFERTWAKASLRCQLEGVKEVTLTRDDFVRASSDSEFVNQEKKRNKIGF